MGETDTASAYPPAARMQEKTAKLAKELKVETKNLGSANLGRDAGESQGTPSPSRPSGSSRPRPQSSREGASSMLMRSISSVKGDKTEDAYSPGPRSAKLSSEANRRELSRKVEAAVQRAEAAEMKCRELQREMQKRQESYLRREQNYKSQIGKLELSLNDYEGNDEWTANYIASEKSLNQREQILHMHAEIQRALGFLHTKKNKKERSSTRIGEEASESHVGAGGTVPPRSESGVGNPTAPLGSHREHQPAQNDWAARLREQEVYVSAERNRDSENQMLLENLANMRQALEQQQLLNEELKSSARLANETTERIRAQFETQEDDREMLIRQVENLRSENTRLKGAIEQGALKHHPNDVPPSPRGSIPPSPAPRAAGRYRSVGAASGRSTGGKSDRAELARAEEISRAKSYEEVVDGLKQLLLQERSRTKKARAAHMAELQQRTRLQGLMREAIEDVRLQRAGISGDPDTHRSAATHSSSGTPRRPASAHPTMMSLSRNGSSANREQRSVTTMLPQGSTTDDLMDEHSRQELVDSLLAKEEVMKLLFDRTFPGVDASPAGKEEAMQRIMVRQDAEEAARLTMPRGGQPAERRPSSQGLRPRNEQSMSSRSMAATVAGGQATMSRQTLNSTSGVSRPWVMDVDGMLADFLGGSPGNTMHQHGASASGSSRASRFN